MPSRSNLDERDRNGNRIGPRPVVGEADPETRRRVLRERLSERQPAPPARAKREPAPAERLNGMPRRSTYDQLKERGRDIDREVDKRSR